MPSFSLKLLWLTFGAVTLLCGHANAQATDVDDKAAAVFAYFAIGNDDNPAASVTEEQFAAQIAELTGGGYNVTKLTDIVEALTLRKALPPHTVALTFDGADRSVIEIALPLLEQHDLPFTVFIPADKVETGKPYMSWDDLRRLKRNPLVTFGIHPASYGRLTAGPAEDIKRQINNAVSAVRKELDVDVTVFAYPFGEYDASYEKIVRSMGFAAAFGQHSGVAYAGDNLYALPRFTITERYGDLERFQMTANALPLPAKDISPSDPHLSTLTPAIGFTVPDTLARSLKALSCFSSTEEKPKLEIINARVELRLEHPFKELRPRINCTLPVTDIEGEEPRWRWFGALYSVSQDLLAAEQLKADKTQARHAADISDEISVE